MRVSLSRRHSGVTAAVAASLALATAARAQPVPQRLTVEYLVAPIAVDEAKPRLGWQVSPTPGARGERQTAYRVLVASSPELLARDTGDLWDSGKVASNRTTQIVYEGRPLQPEQTAHWKVRAWDASDRLSAWSATSTWTAGLVDPVNWRAEWVAGPAVPPPQVIWTDRAWLDGGVANEPVGQAVRAFRVPVEIPRDRAVRDVVLRFAATATARVHIDGRFLHAPQRLGFVETVDVTGLLGPGAHVLAIAVGPGPRANPEKPVPFPAQAIVGEVVATTWSGETLVTPLGPNAKTQVFETALPAKWETPTYEDGEWIAARAAARGTELRDFQATLAPATFVRTTFDVDKPVRRALLHGSALGNYELRLNGARVGRDHFTPGFTDYGKTLYYNTYDVTTGVRQGRNAVGAIVADGWYAGYVGYRSVPGTFGARHAVSAVLDLEFADGTRRQVVTDRTWRTSSGPILAADQLQGYVYDARREEPGWDTPDVGARHWGPVEALPPPAARLSAYPSQPVREMRTLAARAVTQPVPGVWVVDFGQNLVGWVRVDVQGRAGRKVVIRHGEMLNADGTVYTENLRSARATDVFFTKGGAETFEPRFTFHGFRYASITGLDAAPALDRITAVVVHNDLPETGAFASSDDLVNQIFANTLWGQRGNYLEVPTDCPQRDERLGWMGDAQVFARTAAYNMDVAAFLTKWLVDVRDAQLPEGAFSNISPRLPDEPRPGAPGWGDAGVIVPWTLYRQYGDVRVLERHYDAMTRWVAWIAGENPDHLWTKRLSSNYGDWLSPEGVGVKELYATAYYAYSTHLVAETARVLGKADDARRFTELRDRIREAFTQAYVEPDGRLQGDTQTAYLLALKFDLVPQGVRGRLAARLFERLAARDGHLGTGFLGVNVLLPTLTDLGRTDAAYQLLTKTTYPSWGYSIVNGATTIWERWDSYTREKGFGSVGMNSFNHYAYGSVVEWLYATVLGIDTLEPGFATIAIKPQPGAPLTWARGHYDSVHGRIASEWRLEAGRLTMNVTIPPNTTAEIHVPAKDVALVTEGGRPARQSPGLTWLRAEDGYVVFEVGSGQYAFAVGS